MYTVNDAVTGLPLPIRLIGERNSAATVLEPMPAGTRWTCDPGAHSDTRYYIEHKPGLVKVYPWFAVVGPLDDEPTQAAKVDAYNLAIQLVDAYGTAERAMRRAGAHLREGADFRGSFPAMGAI